MRMHVRTYVSHQGRRAASLSQYMNTAVAGPARLEACPALKARPAQLRLTSQQLQITGELVVPQDGKYSFYVRADDGVRVFVDGQLLADLFPAYEDVRLRQQHAAALPCKQSQNSKAELLTSEQCLLARYWLLIDCA